jgi:secreted trypsin-like serine protease
MGRRRRDVSSAVNYLVGGKNAEPGEHPWHVDINIQFKNNFTYHCGGNIVSRTVILTGTLNSQ